MPRLLKKILFSQKLLSKKQSVFLLLIFLFFALCLPAFSNAQVFETIVWAWETFGSLGAVGGAVIGKIGEIIITAALQIILLIANAALTISNILLKLAIQKGGLITLSYTDPVTNPIIGIGWTLVRDLTNMFFILGLVYIGLATALRTAGFETKRIFPRLLAVALLINFTPTICGIVVDISNLVMNFFLEDMTGLDAIGKAWGQQLEALFGVFSQAPTLASVGKTMALIFFAITAAIVIFCFFFLFLVRYVAIWLLVIISPFAFFALIFPKSKGYFSMWWKQFFQWSFVGATGAFFLYLGQHILLAADTKKIAISNIPGELGPFSGLLNNLLPYAVPIIFLYAGYILALKGGAMGADKVVGIAKAVGRGLGGLAWQTAQQTKSYQWLKGKTTRALKGKELKEGEEPSQSSLARAARYLGLRPQTDEEAERWGGSGWKGIGKKALRTAAKAGASFPLAGLPYWSQRAGRYLGAAGSEATSKGISAAEGKAKGKTLEKQVDLLKSAVSRLGKIGALLAIIKDGNLDDAKDLMGLKDWEIKDILESAITLSPAAAKDIARTEPIAAEKLLTDEDTGRIKEDVIKRFGPQLKQAGLAMSDDDYKTFGTLGKKLMAKAKASVIENQWTSDTMKTAVATVPTHQFWDPSQWAAAGRKFSVAFFDELAEQRKEDKLNIDADWYEKYNPPAFRYFKSSAAQAVGIGFTEVKGKWEPAEKRKPPPEGPGTTPIYTTQEEKKAPEAAEGAEEPRPARGAGGVGPGKTPRGAKGV